jgi:GDP-L-fucose synthase
MLLESNPYGSEPVNIGAGSDLTIKELAEAVALRCGYNGEILWDERIPDGMPRKLMDISRIKKIGFTPKISIEMGIKLLCEEYKRQKAVLR